MASLINYGIHIGNVLFIIIIIIMTNKIVEEFEVNIFEILSEQLQLFISIFLKKIYGNY